MIRKILGLPVHLLRKLLGREKKNEAAAVRPPPVRPPPAPRPPPTEEDDRGHDHGHSHDHGHRHDHGHSHDHGREEAPAPVAEPKHEQPAARNLNIVVEETPNPNARKFVCGVPVVEKGSLIFNSAAEAEANPVARAIFALGGIRSVFMVKDFVSVTREPSANWENLASRIVDSIQRTLS